MRQQDEKIDELYSSIFRELVGRLSADPTQAIGFVHLLFCAKNIERIGDHATNIAETVFYLVTGDALPGERPKGPHDYDTHPIGTQTP